MNYLKYLRINRRLTQRALGSMVGCHPNTINKIENGWLAKCPAGLEDRLSKIFGSEWDFQKLTQQVPKPKPPATAETKHG